MSVNLGTEDSPAIALVNLSGGMVDAIVRATDADTFEAAARWAELRFEVMETITDEETGETTTQGTGVWETSPGVNISHIGPVITTPGTYDDEGNEITAPVYDTRHHVNIRLTSPAIDRVDEYGVTKWEKWALAWSLGGDPDVQINKAEEGKILQGVCLIDPDTINIPERVWL